MTALEKATAILPDMSQGEIAQLVQAAARAIAAGFPQSLPKSIKFKRSSRIYIIAPR